MALCEYGNISVTVSPCPTSGSMKLGNNVDARGHSRYARWFDHLDARAAARVATALFRMERGNLSNAKGVGGGVFEYRIDFGPGYRIYFGKDGDTLIILLGGGTKARQQRDIENTRHLWQEYRLPKPVGD